MENRELLKILRRFGMNIVMMIGVNLKKRKFVDTYVAKLP